MPSKNWGGKREAAVINELLIRQVASLVILHKTQFEISKEANLSLKRVREVLLMPETRAMIKEAGDGAIEAAKATVRLKVAKLADLVVEVLTEKLEQERSLEAVKVTLPLLGLKEQEPATSGNTSLTVVLPGVGSKKEIEVPNDSPSTDPDSSDVLFGVRDEGDSRA